MEKKVMPMEQKAKTQERVTTLKTRPKYEPPEVVTYPKGEILKQMWPVRGGSFDPLAPDSLSPPRPRKSFWAVDEDWPNR